jgi:hypothetical protein
MDGSIEFDLYVDYIEVRADETIIVGTRSECIHYVMDGRDLPFRSMKNGSLLITLDEIASFLVNEKGFKHFELHFNEAYVGAIYIYGNDENTPYWSLFGITNGYA